MRSGYGIEMTRVAGASAWALRDEGAGLRTTWVPRAGMLGASLVHRGEEMLWQGAGVPGYAREGKFMGIPFLHPWANRLDGFSYRAGGHEVVLDPASPLLKLNNGLPIHGVLTASRRWVVREVAADGGRAKLSASFAFDRPELLAVFPFRHRVDLEVELSGGALSVRTTLTATGSDAVPVAFGFHPYLQIPGIPRAEWEVRFPVRRRLVLDSRLIPTGATKQVRPLTGAIGNRTWDDAFDRVEKQSSFTVHGGERAIEVQYTDGYPCAQIFAPPEQEYICIEPMTAPGNALAGPDERLEWVPPGEQRSASFRIACRLHS